MTIKGRRSVRSWKAVFISLLLVFTSLFGTVDVSAAGLAKPVGTTTSITSGYYILSPECAPSSSLMIKGSSSKNKANAYLYKYLKKKSQVFYIKSYGDGTYTIRNMKSGKYLEVASGSSKNKANVRQNKKISNYRWRWYIVKTSSGYVIQASYSKKVMTVKNSKSANKTNVYMYTYKSLSGQHWALVPYNTDVTSKTLPTLRGTASTAAKTAAATTTAAATRKVAVSTINGQKTLKTFLENALVPVGRTLYIWGGGWGGIGSDTAVIGYQSGWNTFFTSHATSSYNYTNYRYKYGSGLDCSGFVAWTTYNTLYTENGKADLVCQSTKVASYYNSKGWATLSTDYSSKEGKVFKPGDVVSMNGHVWISLGTCSDGSVLLVHSSPRGVQISGTSGTAATLASKYMKKYFPEWPYAARTVSSSYLKYVGKATWKVKGGILTDSDGIQNMSAENCMKAILGSV